MNWATLSSRDRRALLLGGAVLLGLIVAVRGVPTLVRLTTEARAEARALNQELASAQADLALARRPKGDSGSRGLDSLLWPDARPARFMGLLARFVADAAQRSHVRVTSLRAEAPDSARRTLVTASVLLAGECDIAGCAELLAGLESATPAVRVSRLRMQASDVAAGDDRAERLQVELTVDAMARASAP